jgi:predicted aspartyl protease
LPKPVAVLHGKVVNNAFLFPIIINGTRLERVAMDTGACELIINHKMAERLGLPNLGFIKIRGVGGVTTAYRSKCNLKIGKHKYQDVPCIIARLFSREGLFGLRFFIDNRLKLTLNPDDNTLTITQGKV